ncbi:hypothetical protein AVEN_40347-1 [Araneus ventricosus]|uniref:Uncharacterized protein n=1 Tax=Araneus ventricosus TaxID=182803 RepID=A0A4Y2F4Y8_ARAVE|nr:hypothetical protein AVEN_40347-1 [Araneus ventricosus]
MTITELNRKQTAYKNKQEKIEQFVNAFQAVDETKDYIELKSKLNRVNDILKELDNLQKEYCDLPDKIELNYALDILSDMEEDAEKLKICSSFHNTKLHRDKTDVSIASTAERFNDTAPKVNSEQCFALRSTDNKNSKPMKRLMSRL